MPKHLQSRVAVIVVPAIHPEWCQAYGKKCAGCHKTDHFRGVCRSIRSQTVQNLEQEPDQYQGEDDHTDMVNINFINFNSKSSSNKSKLHKSKLE